MVFFNFSHLSIHTHKRESPEISKSNPPRFEGYRPPRNANKVSKDRLFIVDCHGQKKSGFPDQPVEKIRFEIFKTLSGLHFFAKFDEFLILYSSGKGVWKILIGFFRTGLSGSRNPVSIVYVLCSATLCTYRAVYFKIFVSWKVIKLQYFAYHSCCSSFLIFWVQKKLPIKNILIPTLLFSVFFSDSKIFCQVTVFEQFLCVKKCEIKLNFPNSRLSIKFGNLNLYIYIFIKENLLIPDRGCLEGLGEWNLDPTSSNTWGET